MANEVAPVKKDLDFWLNSDKFQESVRVILPKYATPERFFKLCTAARTKNPKLMECTPASVLQCLVDLSAMGLEPDGRLAHLIPYRTKIKGEKGQPDKYVMICQLIVDYKGLAELAYRSGLLKRMPRAEVVRENDFFEWVDGKVTHKIDFRMTLEQRGTVFAAYSCVWLKDSDEPDYCTLSWEEIESVRKSSRAATSGPWVTHWDEMAKKSAFKRHSKWLPRMAAEFYDALEKDFDSLAETMEQESRTPSRPLFGSRTAELPEATSEPIDIPVEDEKEPVPVETQEEIDARQLREQLAKEQAQEGLFPPEEKGKKR